MDFLLEPYRSRVVEPLRLTSREERLRLIAEAGYNPFLLKAEHVLIDLVTDSGVSALSTRQWSAMHASDESFTGSRSFYRFEAAARALFGHRHVIPCHQGRAAEHLLCTAVLRPGDVVFANTHFATTRANVEQIGAVARDVPISEAADLESPHPFKGNIDLGALERGIAEVGAEKVRFIILTVTDNSTGGQPVSMANLRAASTVCRRHRVPLLLDAARFAENCYLIKLREEGYGEASPRAIAEEMFSLTDGVFMSLKKDALGNSGGLISLRDDAWAEAVRVQLLISEGLPTAGGLAGRDLEGLAVALEEMLDEAHLAYRIASVARFGARLADAGVPCLQPFGGHAVYVDGRAFCPHLPDEQLPAWSLSCALYVDSAIRTWEVGNVMHGRQDAATGAWHWPALDLLRLAIPRRVYSENHLEYAARAVIELHGRALEVRGLRWDYRPPVLPQFIARFRPVEP